MDPTLLASGAIALLVTFLKATADKTVEMASEATAGGLRSLYQTIKAKFMVNEVDAGVLDRLEADPESTARQRALEGVLIEAIQDDPQFAAEVARLLAGAEATSGITVVDSGAVAGGDVHQRGRYVAGRDLTVGVDPPQR